MSLGLLPAAVLGTSQASSHPRPWQPPRVATVTTPLLQVRSPRLRAVAPAEAHGGDMAKLGSKPRAARPPGESLLPTPWGSHPTPETCVSPQVPGNFHVSTHSATAQPPNPDMTHVIHKLSFGDTLQVSGAHSRWHGLGVGVQWPHHHPSVLPGHRQMPSRGGHTL